MFKTLFLFLGLLFSGLLSADIKTSNFATIFNLYGTTIEIYARPLDNNGIPMFQTGVTYIWSFYNSKDSLLETFNGTQWTYNLTYKKGDQLKICMHAYANADSVNNTIIVCNQYWIDSVLNPANSLMIPYIVFHDANKNCVKESGETNLNLLLTVRRNNLEYDAFNLGSDTGYIWLDSGDYTISATSGNYSIPCSGFKFHSGLSYINTVQEIPVYIDSNICDLEVYGGQSSTWGPGDTSYMDVEWNNWGFLNVSDSISIEIPDSINIIEWEVQPDAIYKNRAVWKRTINGGDAVSMAFSFVPSPTYYTIKDSLQFTVYTSCRKDDWDTLNNRMIIKGYLIGSFDPNNKEVYGRYPDKAESPVEYVIHFQNTGTAPAKRVVIIDTLPPQADPNSLQMLSASHSVSIRRDGPIVAFIYQPINLPDSGSDYKGSQGYVRFVVTMRKPGGTGARENIENTASIYFDYNEPVRTNKAVISAAVGLLNRNEFNTVHNHIKIYPNPGSKILNIYATELFSAREFSLRDFTGKTVASGVLKTNIEGFSADFSSVKNTGIYFLFLDGKYAGKWQKITE